MLITYIRSSSFQTWDFCNNQYFINYVLGVPLTGNKKTEKGTIVHKVLECLAKIKQEFQNSKTKLVTLNDENIGKIENIHKKDLLKPHMLSNKEVEDINRTRINKLNYKHPCKIAYDHTRFGTELVDVIIKRVYDYYYNISKHKWQPVDFRDCANWVWMALDEKGGMFDPRKRNIIATEPHFDIKIDKKWAKYNYILPNGKKISGNLAIKGTIDLIVDDGDGIIEIIDWKTGQRYDWAKCKDKKYHHLKTDFQLLLYYYACKKLYPQAKQVIITIFYIRDGGPFTLCYDEQSIYQTENMIYDRFEEIKECTIPKMLDKNQNDFRCTRICDYYKIISPDGKTNLCKFINEKLHTIGMDKVVQKYSRSNFDVDAYVAPG